MRGLYVLILRSPQRGRLGGSAHLAPIAVAVERQGEGAGRQAQELVHREGLDFRQREGKVLLRGTHDRLGELTAKGDG